MIFLLKLGGSLVVIMFTVMMIGIGSTEKVMKLAGKIVLMCGLLLASIALAIIWVGV